MMNKICSNCKKSKSIKEFLSKTKRETNQCSKCRGNAMKSVHKHKGLSLKTQISNQNIKIISLEKKILELSKDYKILLLEKEILKLSKISFSSNGDLKSSKFSIM